MLPHAMPDRGAASRKPIDQLDDSTSAAGMMNRPSAKPAVMNPFVTSETFAPRRINAPAPQPPRPSAPAKITNGSAPNSARWGSVTCRTLIRYDGSPEMTKYQKKSQQNNPTHLPLTSRFPPPARPPSGPPLA